MNCVELIPSSSLEREALHSQVLYRSKPRERYRLRLPKLAQKAGYETLGFSFGKKKNCSL